MGSIWAAVRWWDEWQMRILISGSLFIQWFLLLAAPMRKYTIRSGLRFFIWLAYLSCDALAIYALATLFNRQAKASSPCYVGYRASSIEVLWAPILLIHLGGREEITAFDIEDNELWTRQTVTLVSQVTVALYAFYKTWPSSGDNRLLWSAILLFVIGILSFCEKPWALRRASINRLVAVSSLAAGTRKEPKGWEYLCAELKAEDIKRWWKKTLQRRRHQEVTDGNRPILSELDKIQMILSDLSLLAADKDMESRGRGRSTTSGSSILDKLDVELGGERRMKRWLRSAFGLIYTRSNLIWTPAYLACHLLLVPSLHVAAIALFATSHKQAYRQFNAIDVRMTYIVLFLTAVLDVFGLLISELVYKIMSWIDVPALCETLPGHNLIDAALKSKTLRGRVFNCLTCCGKIAFSSDVDRGNMYMKVAGMVLLDLISDRSLRDLDFASYRSSIRDKNWILGGLAAFDTTFGQHGNPYCQMVRSLRGLPFDVSVLHWHIATDLCFRSSTRQSWQTTYDPVSLHRECAAGVSDYMAHLLYSRPEMLMTGSRKHLFIEAMDKTSQHLGVIDTRQPPLNRENLDKFMEAATTPPGSDDPPEDQCPLVRDACSLARELLAMPEDERWEVMYHVWIGMLCYSASMCRGYLHAKSLGEGGEFLSFISIVIALKGGKTLADKLQMPDHGSTDHRQTLSIPSNDIV